MTAATQVHDGEVRAVMDDGSDWLGWEDEDGVLDTDWCTVLDGGDRAPADLAGVVSVCSCGWRSPHLLRLVSTADGGVDIDATEQQAFAVHAEHVRARANAARHTELRAQLDALLERMSWCDVDEVDQVALFDHVRERAEAAVVASVVRARRNRRVWEEIGASLGLSRQAAQQRYGKHVTDEAKARSDLWEAAEWWRRADPSLGAGCLPDLLNRIAELEEHELTRVQIAKAARRGAASDEEQWQETVHGLELVELADRCAELSAETSVKVMVAVLRRIDDLGEGETSHATIAQLAGGVLEAHRRFQAQSAGNLSPAD